jgi:cobalt-zinc-cadmium resistance protein CzcA
VRSDGSITSLDDLRAIAITQQGGMAVRVGDVARCAWAR